MSDVGGITGVNYAQLPYVGGFALERVAEVDSTNLDLLRRAAALPDRYALLADRQLQGRGRRGREWHSADAGNLYLSLFARLQRPIGQLEGLSLAVGMAIAQALQSAGVLAVKLKWPNDLLVDGSKLGGILIEVAETNPTSCGLVIGLGLNIAMPDHTGIDQPWTDLARLGAGTDREFWLHQLVPAIEAALQRFEREGFAPFVADWPQWDALAGREVRLQGGERPLGTVLGIDEHGALRLRDQDGEWLCHSGEVSVRLLDAVV